MINSVLLIITGIIFYFANVLLVRYYLQKNLPELKEDLFEKMPDGDYLFEKTAGLGIVPKWVSLIGIFSYFQIATGILLLILNIIAF